MPSQQERLKELAAKLNQSPDNSDVILGEYLEKYDLLPSILSNLQLITNQLQRFQKIFEGIKLNLEEEEELTPSLIAAQNHLNQATSHFSSLLEKVRDLNHNG